MPKKFYMFDNFVRIPSQNSKYIAPVRPLPLLLFASKTQLLSHVNIILTLINTDLIEST